MTLIEEESDEDLVVEYPVRGRTLAEAKAWLDSKIAAFGTQQGNSRYEAFTHWDWRWWVEVEPAAGACSIRRIRFCFVVETSLPDWKECSQAPPDEQAEWNRYRRALAEHERGHAKIGIAAKETFIERANQLQRETFVSEEEAWGRVKQIAAPIYQTAPVLDRAYDEASNHGAAEGALIGFEGKPKDFTGFLEQAIRLIRETP